MTTRAITAAHLHSAFDLMIEARRLLGSAEMTVQVWGVPLDVISRMVQEGAVVFSTSAEILDRGVLLECFSVETPDPRSEAVNLELTREVDATFEGI